MKFEYDNITGTVEYKNGRYYGEYDGKEVNHKTYETFMNRHWVHKKSLEEIGVEVEHH